MTRVLFFGTHYKSSNGYSSVVYELCKELSKHSDIQLTLYGFQNFHTIPNHRDDFPKNVHVYDAWANEEPKQAGFGIGQVKEFVTTNRPDVCIVYNDLLVLSSIIAQLKEVPNRHFKIIAYIDQVYLCQKKEYITFVNENADVAMLFTPYWEDIIKEQGITIPTCHLQHGFSKDVYFPVPKNLARKFYGLKDEDFIVLNLNRNQPRKRWDICLQAFAEVVAKYPNEPIKLLVATAVQGAWNLLEIFERELKKRGMTLQDGMKHLILLDNPQQLADEDINFLYNVADIGINACDGEGQGLCNYQQAAIGIPQVLPALGGYLDYFNESNSMLCKPVMTYYVDNSRDMVCGEAELIAYRDLADGILKYYTNRDLTKQHGEKCREEIHAKYSWKDLSDKLYHIIKDVAKHLEPIQEEEEIININSLTTMVEDIAKPSPDNVLIQPPASTQNETPETTETQLKEKSTKSSKKHSLSSKKEKELSVKEQLREKLKKKKEAAANASKQSSDMDQIKELKAKLEKLMAKTGA